MLIKMGCGGVDLSRLHPAIWHAIKIAHVVWNKEEIIITSTWEGTHVDWSFHYRYEAFDLRPPQFARDHKVITLREQLGPDYDVVDEGDHIHIEYDPKGG